MYVRDLEPGLLIRPVENYAWSVDKLYFGVAGGELGAEELIENGIHHHATPRFVPEKFRGVWAEHRCPAVYLGVKQLRQYYYGVKRQHMVLINGTVAVIDGYQFKEIEKV